MITSSIRLKNDYANLDLLRAIAVLLVVLSHLPLVKSLVIRFFGQHFFYLQALGFLGVGLVFRINSFSKVVVAEVVFLNGKIVQAIVTVVVTFILSFVAYYLIEEPMVRLGVKISSRRVFC